MVRHSNWLFPFLVAHSHCCYPPAAPGEEMVPLKEPMVVRGAVRVAGYTKRLTVKPPVAVTTPAKRPLKGTCSPAATVPTSPSTAKTANTRLAAELWRFMASPLCRRVTAADCLVIVSIGSLLCGVVPPLSRPAAGVI